MKTNHSVINSGIHATLLVALLAFGTSVAQGGFLSGGLGGLAPGNKNPVSGSGATVDIGAFTLSAGGAVSNVLSARIMYFQAQEKLAEAFGLKTDALQKQVEALRAIQGATSDSDKVAALNDSTQTSKEADQQLEDAMAKSTELSAESKAKYSEGTGMFIQGVVLESGQIAATQKLVEQGQGLAQSASPLDKVKVLGIVKPITTLATILPGDIKEASTTLGQIMKFSKKENIEVPNSDKATDLIGNL